MIYRGRVKDGVVVLDDEVKLVEGAQVLVQLPSEASDLELLDEIGETLAQKMLRFAGRAKGLPSDLARNHDHYLHGAPKQSMRFSSIRRTTSPITGVFRWPKTGNVW